MPVGRIFLRLVDLLPLPSLRVQRVIAAAVILSQGGIAVTGAIVRVTASGLGCPTWPQCFPGSFTPIPHPEVAGIHQAVEFGNRMITFLVVLTAALAVLAVTRARRRREVLIYAWLMPASTVVQAVIGGITVLTGLLWWTVAIHLLASMTMVWVSVLLYVKIGEPDNGTVVRQVPKPLRQLTFLSAAVLAMVLVTGTLVTGAGPHAGDKSIENPVPRLQVEIVTLVQLHATLLVAYLSLLIALVFALRAVAAPGPWCGVWRYCWRWSPLRLSSAVCSTPWVSPRRWSPSTSPARPPAPQRRPRYGRRCDSGPRPSRSRVFSTPTTKSRCRRARVAGSS